MLNCDKIKKVFIIVNYFQRKPSSKTENCTGFALIEPYTTSGAGQSSSKSKAFTLIELLIVIGIIAILAAAVIIAINPGKQFAAARDATRQNYIDILHKALISYQIDNFGDLGDLDLPAEPIEICNINNTDPMNCDTLIDLSPLVNEGYISKVPVDPQGGVSQDGTGYFIAETEEGNIILIAEKAEGDFISIGIKESEYVGEGSCDGFTYSPTGSWGSKIDTTVRDYYTPDNSSATVNKDIYCDDENCIFLADGATAPSGDICVSESSEVYLGLLWDKTDMGTGSYEYGDYQNGEDDSALSSLGVVGGTHVSNLEIGVDNRTEPASSDWLDKNYDTNSYTFPAMDVCTAKGEGWYLPNFRELDSIRDQSNGSALYTDLPNIDSGSFPYYLSSTEYGIDRAYVLDAGDGSVMTTPKSAGAYVRCVRGQ